MSAGHKSSLVACYDQHHELSASNYHLIKMGEVMSLRDRGNVAGMEDFKEKSLETLESVGRGLFSVTKWVGGKALDGFLTGITMAGNQITKSFSENQSLIKNVLKDSSKVADKDLKVSAAKIAQITATGNPDDILRDMDTLVKTLALLDKHQSDVMAYLDKELVTVKKLKSATKADQIHAVIDEFESLTYPVFELGNNMGKAKKSDVLPGGRFFIFSNEGTPKYSISGEAPSGEAKTLTMSKSQIDDILNKLEKVNDLHNRVKESYDRYAGFIKSWGEMVKGVDNNLTRLDNVSKTVLGESEKLMDGNMGALAFYSGFTPRVVGYTDKYIHGVLGVFA